MANNWAICVGINAYQFLPEAKLSFAWNDAWDMRSFLCQEADFAEEQVLLCGDGQAYSGEPERQLVARKTATRAVLRDILKNQLARAKGADNLWFFFSGHGMAGSNQDFLMTTDGNPADLEETALPLHFVTDQLRACQAKNIVLVLDMCRSEAQQMGQKSAGAIGAGLPDLIKQREGEQGIITLFSCARGESSYELKDLQRGAFTYALLEGLRQHTILKDLDGYLARRVPELNGNAFGVRKQVPLVIPEPGWKYEAPILNDFATRQDVARMQEMAIDAECEEELEKAIRLWEQVNLLAYRQEDRNRAMRRLQQLAKRLGLLNPTQPKAEPPHPLSSRGKSKHTTSVTPHFESPTEDDLSSEVGVDYSLLQQLLKKAQELGAAQAWMAADKETLRVMLKAAGCDGEGWLNSDSFRTLPCTDLRTVNQLWVKYSIGTFGFTVQKKIWDDCGSPKDKNGWRRFGSQVGWRNSMFWLDSPSLKSLGSLPWAPWRGYKKIARVSYDPEFGEVIRSSDGSLRELSAMKSFDQEISSTKCILFYRVKNCKL